MGALDGTLTHSSGCVAGVDAVAPFYYLGYEVAVGVEVAGAGFGDALAGGGEEFVFKGGQELVYLVALGLGERCACVAFDATFAETCVDVAAEKLFRKVKRNKCVLYL